jgi:hypothetical protein
MVMLEQQLESELDLARRVGIAWRERMMAFQRELAAESCSEDDMIPPLRNYCARLPPGLSSDHDARVFERVSARTSVPREALS